MSKRIVLRAKKDIPPAIRKGQLYGVATEAEADAALRRGRAERVDLDELKRQIAAIESEVLEVERVSGGDVSSPVGPSVTKPDGPSMTKPDGPADFKGDVSSPSASMTKDEIKSELDAMGVPYDTRARKDSLAKLYEDHA